MILRKYFLFCTALRELGHGFKPFNLTEYLNQYVAGRVDHGSYCVDLRVSHHHQLAILSSRGIEAAGGGIPFHGPYCEVGCIRACGGGIGVLLQPRCFLMLCAHLTSLGRERTSCYSKECPHKTPFLCVTAIKALPITMLVRRRFTKNRQ